ncbi:MAG: class F sortase [Chloroflexota bacterium]
MPSWLTTPPRWAPRAAGTFLLVAGIGMVSYALLAHLDIVPGTRTSVPVPPAIERARATATTLAASAPIQQPTSQPTAAPEKLTALEPFATATAPPPAMATPATVLAPIPPIAPAAPDTLPLAPADAAERPFRDGRPRPGPAVRLQIPAIRVDTKVIPGGMVVNKRGELEWETVPFVAAHYTQTSRVGTRGNAVIVGHVVTINEGNVFRDLYRLDFGDALKAFTEDGIFTYTVRELRLVSPDAIDVMAPTPDATLTLITCGGEFDPRTRQFSDRLIVIAKLVDWARRPVA